MFLEPLAQLLLHARRRDDQQAAALSVHGGEVKGAGLGGDEHLRGDDNEGEREGDENKKRAVRRGRGLAGGEALRDAETGRAHERG